MTDILETVATSFRNWRTRRSTITALSNLSDHALKDIGLGRSEVRSVATELANEATPRRRVLDRSDRKVVRTRIAKEFLTKNNKSKIAA